MYIEMIISSMSKLFLQNDKKIDMINFKKQIPTICISKYSIKHKFSQ